MPLALVAAVGLVLVAYLVLSKPATTAPRVVTPQNTAGLAGTVRQYTAGAIGGPTAPLNMSGSNARPNDAQLAEQGGAAAFATLPGLVTAIGSQSNASTKIANDQALAVLKLQPQTNVTGPSAQQPTPTLRAPAGTEQTANQFAASSGTVTQDVVLIPPDMYAGSASLPRSGDPEYGVTRVQLTGQETQAQLDALNSGEGYL